MNPLLLLAVGGGALAWLASSGKDAHAAPEGGGGLPSTPKAKPKTKPVPKPKGAKQAPKPAGTLPPADVLGRIVAATASGDASKMRAEAAQLRNDGWTEQAASLEAAAATVEAAQANTGIVPILPSTVVNLPPSSQTPPAAGGMPSLTLPAPPSVTVTLPEIPTTVAQAQSQAPQVITVKPKPSAGGTSGSKAGANLAIELQRHLALHPIWKEDRALVKKFQAQEGLTVDGLYGPQTAKASAKYDLVPTRPYYWPKSTATAAKGEWRTYALAQAMRDPSRSEEWKGVA